MLRKLRADAAGRKFAEDCGKLKQIFPPREQSQLDRYMKLLETACSLYEPGLETEQKHEVRRFLVQKVRKQNNDYRAFGTKETQESTILCFPSLNTILVRRILLSEPCTIILRMCSSGLSYSVSQCVLNVLMF